MPSRTARIRQDPVDQRAQCVSYTFAFTIWISRSDSSFIPGKRSFTPAGTSFIVRAIVDIIFEIVELAVDAVEGPGVADENCGAVSRRAWRRSSVWAGSAMVNETGERRSGGARSPTW